MTVKCRPKYLPQEFTYHLLMLAQLLDICTVPLAVNGAGLQGLLTSYQGILTAELKAMLPKLHQDTQCAIRGANTLDKVYSNIKQGYRAKPLPHLGRSDHISQLLIPAYTSFRKSALTTKELLKHGLKVLLTSCRTASKEQTGICLNDRTC